MFNVTDDFGIEITRGDTATLELVPREGSETTTDADVLIAALKRSPESKTPIWEKRLIREDTGSWLLLIRSEDTADLPFGRYSWDVRMLWHDGDVQAPFADRPFVVTKVDAGTVPPETGGEDG